MAAVMLGLQYRGSGARTVEQVHWWGHCCATYMRSERGLVAKLGRARLLAAGGIGEDRGYS